MPLNDLNRELVSYIANTDDEEILSLLIEDLIFYFKMKNAAKTGDSYQEQLYKRKALLEEEDSHENGAPYEFKRVGTKIE